MAYDEETYEKLAGNFQLLCNIIRQKSEGEQLKVDLSRIGNDSEKDTGHIEGKCPGRFL